MYLEEPKIEFLPVSLTNIVCSSDCSVDGNFGTGGVTGCYGGDPFADELFGCRSAADMFVWD